MAKRESVFADEWRRCLREHYKYVVKQQDKNTEETLTPILERFGFREDELRRLEIEATMRADDMPDDFVPDMELKEVESVEVSDEAPQAETTFTVHPAECQCADCMDVVLEEGHDEDGQPIELDPEEEQAKKDTPKQRSLF
ncbi:MAG: hypothetical protein AAF846_12125 [Chloroflexota bacterium]